MPALTAAATLPVALPVAPSPPSALDAAVATVAAHKAEWATLAPADKARLLARLRRDFARVAARWVTASAAGKGIGPDDPAVGQEWLNGPYTVLNTLRRLELSLRDIAAGRRPRLPGPVTVRPDGQVIVRVAPRPRTTGCSSPASPLRSGWSRA